MRLAVEHAVRPTPLRQLPREPFELDVEIVEHDKPFARAGQQVAERIEFGARIRQLAFCSEVAEHRVADEIAAESRDHIRLGELAVILAHRHVDTDETLVRQVDDVVGLEEIATELLHLTHQPLLVLVTRHLRDRETLSHRRLRFDVLPPKQLLVDVPAEHLQLRPQPFVFAVDRCARQQDELVRPSCQLHRGLGTLR